MNEGGIVVRSAQRITDAREQALERPVHDDRTAAILGIALGVAFGTCFVTGLISHLIQHPPSWFEWPSRPAGLYRVTQGVHVATGIASVPLLLAKLWSVYPRLFTAPRRNLGELLERVSLVPLVMGALFMLFTGVTNIDRWYVWRFYFPRAHFWGAWITIGALIVHVGAKIGTTRAALRADPDRAAEPARAPGTARGLSRRVFLGSVAAASAGLTLTTIGETLNPLGPLVAFAPRRPDIGSQGLPVNVAASQARVETAATDPNFLLSIEVDGAVRASFSVAELEAMPQHQAVLPIACVEGWSKNAHWSGVPVRDLLARVGVPHLGSRGVDVLSLQPRGLNRSHLTAGQAGDHDTMLALHLNGERLNLDHGYPVRLIAPNRPGELNTKWVERLVVT
jgi:Oxidoreductase molybdopterin binding domain